MQSQKARVRVGKGLPGKVNAFPGTLSETPGSGSQFLPWRNGYYRVAFFSLTVVKMRDCKSETNLATGEENQVLEVALDVFLQS